MDPHRTAVAVEGREVEMLAGRKSPIRSSSLSVIESSHSGEELGASILP